MCCNAIYQVKLKESNTLMLSITETSHNNHPLFEKVFTFFKILAIRTIVIGESIGAAKAAQQLFSLNYREEAQAVMMNYRRSAEAKSRLIKSLKK